MKNIDNYNFENKKVLIRVDFNVPLNEKFEVTDATRIEKAIPTLQKVLKKGGAVILMSHLGRPKGKYDEKYSLKHVIPTLEKALGKKVQFADNCIGEKALEQSKNLKSGEVLLLENLRFHNEEKSGDETFAKTLSTYADVYMNDAFGTAHRAHASTTIVAKFFEEKLFGYIMESEINNLEKVLSNPERPLTAILGGAKVSGKIQVIDKMIEKADHILIGGGMMFTFIKAMGGNVGNSLVEEELIDVAKKAIEKAEKTGAKLWIPTDTIIADKFDNEANTKMCDVNEIPDGWMGLDIGEKTAKQFEEVITNSKTILWNGPMGVFEMKNFAKGTQAIAESVVKATQKGAFSLVGGGDSVAAINNYGYTDDVSYVSTGGGAMLEYVEGKILPAIAAMKA